MYQYIVTVKLPKNPEHDPRNKKIGFCPVNPARMCTDVTGEHHSYVIECATMDEAYKDGIDRFGHVTRIEVL